MTRATDIEQRACEWIIRSEAGIFTQEMRAEMQLWLQDPRNRVTYLRLNEAWRRAGRIRGARPLDGNVDPDLLKDPNLSVTPQESNVRPQWPLRIAAAVLTLMICVGLLLWSQLGPSSWISYTTSVGGYEHLTLSDGSDIELNTDSQIRVRLSAARREVQLIRGEVLIKVAHDLEQRPFSLRAANATVRADPPADTRAVFVARVRAPRNIDVTVAQGSVILGPLERIIDVALGRASSHSTVGAGEIAAVRPEGIRLSRIGSEEINRKLSWTAGLLSFQGETLSEVTDEFNRYNRKHLVVTDPVIADRRIGGAFQATDPDSFVSALQKWFGVRAEEQVTADTGSSVILLSRTY